MLAISVGGRLFGLVPAQQLVTDFANSSSYDMAGNEYSGQSPPLAARVRARPAAARRAANPCGRAAVAGGVNGAVACPRHAAARGHAAAARRAVRERTAQRRLRGRLLPAE